MPKTEAFETFPREYEAWFDNHPKVYEAEIETIRKLLPPFKRGIEIGIGSGRFALPFGIRTGVEPSKKMAEIARDKDIKVIDGVAEKLPLQSGAYDYVMMVTTICFVDDPLRSLREISRILVPGGYVIIGFVERVSAIGKLYEKNRLKSRFYKDAAFFTAKEVAELLHNAGFEEITSYQTLFGESLENAQTVVKEGSDEGAFIAIRARKGTT